MEPKIALRQAIKQLGGLASFSAAVDAPSTHAVRFWQQSRVPAEYCPRIERITAGAVRCEALRSDIEWNVLRSTGPIEQPAEV